MPAAGVISLYSKLHDVAFERTDASPAQQGDVPIYETSASKLYMGPGGGTGGAFSLGVSDIGNTAGQTGVTGSRIVLAGAGAITLSQLTDANGATITASAPPQSAQTQDRFNLTIGGNTAGVPSEVSSGTLTLAGGANVTLSQNGNAISISAGGAAQTVQTLGLYADGNTTGQSSSTTRDARSVSLHGDGAVSVGFSNGSIRISAPTQSVQPETQTFIGGLAASNTTYTSGTVTLVGSGDITVLSGTGQRIIISGSQSVQPETQTFVGGIAASDTTYTSGTVRITGVGGGVTVSSNTGQRIDISVAAPVAQTGTQFSAGISGGNTSGDTGTVAGRLILAGGNNITLSGSTNGASETITISAGSAAAFSAGVSNLGNSSGDTGVTGTRLVFAGGQSVTLSQSTNANGGTITISGASTSQSVQTQNMVAVTLSGNTSGVQALISSGTLTLAGGNNITVSQNGNAVTISGPNVAGAQTGISGIGNSETTYTSGTVDLRELGAITIRSTTGQRFQLSVDPQSNQTLGLYANGNTTGESSSTTRDARTISIRGDGIVSVGYSNGSLRISASQSVQPETQTFIAGVANTETTYTSGTVKLLELGAITIRSTTGNQFQLSVNSQTNQSEGWYALGNTTGQSSSTTLDARTISIRGDGIVSVGYSGGSLRISASQSVQPETQTFIGGLAASNTTYTSGTITITGVGGGVTVSSNTGQRIDISVAAQTVESQSIGMSNVGNTSGTTGMASGAQVRMVFAGGNNITLSQSLNGASGTLTISAFNQSNQSEGWYALGNTTGQSSSTTLDARTISIRGDGIVSVGYSGGSLRISASQSVQPETQTFLGGIAASDKTYTSGTVVLTGAGGGITVQSNAGQTITLSVAAPVAQTNQSLGMYAVQNTTGQSSSTTMDARTISVAGDGAVSVGYSAGSLRISAPVQTGTQFSAGISGGNTSGDTGTVPGRLVLAGGNGITLSGSTNGSSMTITVSGGAGGGFSAGVSNVGNTSGDTGITGSRLVLSGGNNITLSQSTNASGGTVGISGPNQFSGGFSTQGNTAGDTGFVTGRLALVASNNLTLSGSTNAGSQTVTILGPSTLPVEQMTKAINQASHGLAVGDWVRMSGTSYIKAQANSIAGAEVVGVVTAVADASNFTLTTGGFVSGLSGLTAGAIHYLSDSTAGAITATEPTTEGSVSKPVFIATSTTAGYFYNMRGAVVDTDPTAFLAGVSNLGNTSGDTGATGTRLVLVGSNNITLSQGTGAAGGTVTISGPTQSAQTLGMYAVQNTTAQSSSTTMDARTISVAGDGAVSVGYSAGSLRISAPVQTAESQSIGMSNIGNTSGTTGIASGAQVRMLFAGGNNITLSQSLNGASGTITISAFNQTNQSIGMYAVNNTTAQSSSTTMDARTLSIAGDGAVSVGYSAGSLRISAPAQTGTQFSAGLSNIGNTSGDTGTVAGRLVLAGGNGVTLSGSTNGVSETITISGITQSVQTQGILSAGVSTGGNTSGNTQVSTGSRLVIVGSNGITASQGTAAGASTITLSGRDPGSAGMSTMGNTAGDTGYATQRLNLVGGNNVTLSGSTNGGSMTISIAAPSPGAAQYSIGVSNLGNTAGSTGVTGTRIVFAGTNNISLSQSTDATGATISINNTVSAFLAGVSTIGNTAGDTGVTGTRMVWVGTNPISLSQATGANGGTITIDAPATSSLVGVSGNTISTNGSTISVGHVNLSVFDPHVGCPVVTGQQGQATLHIQPVTMPNVQHDRMLVGVQISNASNSSNSITVSIWVGVYTRNASTLSLISSTSTSYGHTGAGTTGVYSLYGGPRLASVPWTNTLTEGEYYWGINVRSTTGGGAGHSVSQLLVSKFTNSAFSGILGQGSSASNQWGLGLGVLSISTAGIPSTVAFTDIQGTGSLALRAPIFMLRSGTV